MHPELQANGVADFIKFVPSTAKIKDLVEFDPNSITQFNEKSTLRLACFDRCGPICPSLPQFARDGVKLLPENDSRFNITYYRKIDQEPENTLVLTIKDLTLNDSGNYTCISSANPKIFDDIYVTVNSKCTFVANWYLVFVCILCMKQTALFCD